MIAEPINTTDDGTKARTLMAGYYKYGTATLLTNKGFKGGTTAIAEPINVTKEGKSQCIRATYYKDGIRNMVANSIDKRTCVAEPINITDDGKSQTIKAQYSRTSIPNICCYSSTFGATGVATPTDEPLAKQFTGSGKDKDAMKRVYDVKNGLITIKGKQYPIKLADGHYIIRKLTPVECERLQTLPDNYTAAVSNTQRYKGLGNGWTAEVIVHILNGILKDVPRDEEIVVLSMYDGIGTGRYCLDKMGFTNVKYYAYEIDKYAMQVAMSNYPDIVQCGDAFDLRKPDWKLKGGK
jgi:DNA (cytosine-5)-methyltransferase 3A